MFENLNINANACKIVEKFDKDKDGKLNYSEFLKIITPKNDNYLIQCKQNKYYYYA